jgi:4-hydroxythreonine-4-phosphate dehydrogenase
MRDNAPIAVTMGEPQGIGPDLIIDLYLNHAKHKLKPFCVYGSAQLISARAKRLKKRMTVVGSSPDRVETDFARALPVIDIEGDIKDTPGEPSAAAAGTVVAAIEQAVGDTLDGLTRAVVTAPIHKATLYEAGFEFPGHTEFVASLCKTGGVTPRPVMMLATTKLRTVPVTVHIPFVEVPWRLTTNQIVATVRIVHDELKARFGVKKPLLGIAGLNPHAGEDGNMGDQEESVIWPAISTLSAEGVAVEGPLAPDTAFAPKSRARYDAIIAMYHDQALIPIKALYFDSAVNVTLGLPLVRTSPDHGTAFDLAGSGEASSTSMLNAIKLAERLSRN